MSVKLASKPLNSVIHIHFIGAAVVWLLLYLSPSLLAIFFGYDRLHIQLWQPVWESMGYSAYTGVPTCFSDTDGTLMVLVPFLYEGGVGVVGAFFQAVAIRHRYGYVRRNTIIALSILWGVILGSLSAGMMIFSKVDSGQCARSPVYDFFMLPANLYVFIFPIPLILLVAALITRRYWRKEAQLAA